MERNIIQTQITIIDMLYLFIIYLCIYLLALLFI